MLLISSMTLSKLLSLPVCQFYYLYNENITGDNFSDILVATTNDGRKIFTATLTIGDKIYYCEVTGPFGASWRHTVRIMEPVYITHASFTDDEWYGEEAMREFEKM